MNELSIPAESGLVAAPSRQPRITVLDDPTGGRLVAWAQAARAANQLAKALVSTSFVPMVKDKRSGQMTPISEGDATAQILMGDELGLSPLASLRSLFVVHGTPSMYTRTMVALVQSHGHEVWTESTSDASVTVCGRRKGTAHEERSTWTTARAQKAKYTGNPKYQTNPQEMLFAKAAGEVCRKIAADVLAGIPATIEDLELAEPVPTVTVTRTAAPATKAQRKPAAATPEPELTPTQPAAPELRTESQMRHLWALAKDSHLDEAGFRAYLTEELGREVETTKTLTKAEAHHLIEQLQGVTAPEPPIDAETGEVFDAELIEN